MIRIPDSACVIGGGIIGSWAALHLAEAGLHTTLVEQFPLPHARGSSHGASRAFRFLGDEPLDRLDYSLDRWNALAAATGDTLFLQTGLLNLGPPGDPYLEGHMGVLRRAGRPVEWLAPAAIAERWPQARYPGDWGAAWDPNGGVLFADRCLAAVQGRFRELGGEVVTARAAALSARKAGVSVTLERDREGDPDHLACACAVVCAGPWTAGLLPRFAGLLRSLLIPVTYWKDPTGAYRADQGFPILFNARLTGVYGLPACEAHGHVKILYHGGPEAEPGQTDHPGLGAYVEKVGGYVGQYLPLLDHRAPAILETCRYTMSPDSEPIIDRLGDALVVGCGFSGSGFKHAPASGRMLAALALGREHSLPAGFVLERYALDRFAAAAD